MNCPIIATIKVISGKWKTLVIWQLKDGPKRFSSLIDEGKGISAKVLTQQLRELELEGVLRRKVYPTVPPKVEYRLSKHGQSLLPVLETLINWGNSHLARQETKSQVGNG